MFHLILGNIFVFVNKFVLLYENNFYYDKYNFYIYLKHRKVILMRRPQDSNSALRVILGILCL